MGATSNHLLSPGTRIDVFEVQNVLGCGGFGVTYKAWDHQLNRPVAIKEYLPMDLAVRGVDSRTVTPRDPSKQDDYQYGLDRFLDEARTLARFRDERIVRVTRFLEANGTAYLVMEYEEGRSLERYLKDHAGPLDEQELMKIFVPILEGLRAVHAADFLHRDIKPANIYLRHSGPPLLLDFGAAREAIGSQTRSVTSVLTPGYAPFEQYQSRGKQGPWTDIYALGATLYFCVTGIKPEDVTDRIAARNSGEPDPLKPALEVAPRMYGDNLLETIDWMLALDPAGRPQDVDAVLVKLGYGTAAQTAPPAVDGNRDVAATEVMSGPASVPPDAASGERAKTPGNTVKVLGFVAVGVVAAIAVMFALRPQPAPTAAPVTAKQPAPPQVVTPPPAKAADPRPVEPVETAPLAKIDAPVKPTVDTARVERLLSQAEQALEDARLTTPEGDSAHDYYRQVLALDPGNASAGIGLETIVDRYLELAQREIDQQRTDRARVYLQRARDVVPDAPRIARLEAELDRPKPVTPRPPAAQSAGELFDQGWDAEQAGDLSRARQLYLQAAELGHPSAQNNLGHMYLVGNGVATDFTVAEKWLRAAAAQGHERAETSLGYMYEFGKGVAQDYGQAVQWYRRAAQQGFQIAQDNIGLMYQNGRGVARDDGEAVKWFRKAADQGYARGQYNLGYMYSEGRGVSPDLGEARRWYQKAADQGSADAQNDLGHLYLVGRGVEIDYARARDLFEQAARQNQMRAQTSLGYIYETGKGVARDYRRALEWYAKAADQGFDIAQANLGLMYEYGRGVAIDKQIAKTWYEKAAAQGNQEGRNGLQRLAQAGVR